jgi:hypothetical protein
MTEEEMKKEVENMQKEWNDFVEDLQNNPTDSLTKGDLMKALQFISSNLNNLSHMVAVNSHNLGQVINVLHGGMQHGNKTKSGIILP